MDGIQAGEGKVYLAAVLDAYSRRVVGWAIADHIRSELVVDAVQMALWRRQPPDGQTIARSDHGSQGGRSDGGSAAPDCSARWARSVIVSTTRLRRASSERCNSSCSTNTTGRHATTSPTRSSSGSKPGTTRADDTATADKSVLPITKLELPRSRGHLILGETLEEGGPCGPSREVSGGVPA